MALTVVGFAVGAYLAAKAPPSYLAGAVLRLAGERRLLTGQTESASEFGRTTDPLQSLIQLVKNRAVMGGVVDSIGLRLRSATPEFGARRLTGVRVDPAAGNDTILVTFYQNGVKAKLGNREARAHYGQALDLGGVRFTVPAVPDVPSATLYLIPREMAIDGLLAGIQISQRSLADIIDIIYMSPNPQLAQQVVNTTVRVFQQMNILSAKQKSTRRREFLEGQLKQTDSMLARAQAELAVFRSRQQLASSQGALDALQTAMMALDGRRAIE